MTGIKIVFQKQFDRTPSSSRRDGRHGHCDCCYCEMFEHSALETARAGRVPQIRERLRQKLQRRNGQEVGFIFMWLKNSNCFILLLYFWFLFEVI